MLTSSKTGDWKRTWGFTLVELLVVVAVIGVLAGILLPTLAKSRTRAQAILCLSNTKQLLLAWVLYSDDHAGRLAYNIAPDTGPQLASASTPMARNWANNILDWQVSNPDNTNAVKLLKTGLGPYTDHSAQAYHCPADFVLSHQQQMAGWRARVRSYSMNAMLGNIGQPGLTASNADNPDEVQFVTMDSIPDPSRIFVFLDEHPDSIHDGNFLERAGQLQWHELPASYHNGGASFSFVDGHSEIHCWADARTMPPSLPHQAHLPIPIPPNQRQDFDWVIAHMSVDSSAEPAPSLP